MEYKVRIENLIMEVTRRCNMQCDMCLRGDAEREDMPNNVMEAVFIAADEIQSVTPTGGEPFLVPETTINALRGAREKGATSAFLSTNGSISPFSDEGFPVVQEMFSFALHYSTGRELDEEDLFDCIIQVSRDSFHDDRIACYAQWSFLRNVRFQSGTDNSILTRGLARINGIGDNFRDERPAYISCDWGDGIPVITAEQVYVNVFGECFADCDLSYEQQDDEPGEFLPPGCYLGHIGALRETMLELAMKKSPEFFEQEREKAIA